MKTLLFGLLALLIILNPSLSDASDSVITKDLIVEKNEKMEELLTKREPRETIQFLHNHIDEQAVFNIEMNNPTMPAAQTTNQFQMNKQDYINSFITGMHYVDDYRVSIKTQSIDIAADQKTAIVHEVMLEEGTMLNAQDPLKAGLPFSSKTNCTTRYTIQNGQMKSDQASCQTSTAEINTI